MKLWWQIAKLNFWSLTVVLYKYCTKCQCEIFSEQKFSLPGILISIRKKKLQYPVFCVLFHSSLWDAFYQFLKVVQAQKAPDKNIPQKEANVFFFFLLNSTFKSATSDTFSLLLDRFFFFPAQKVQLNLPTWPWPSSCSLRRCSAAVAVPSLSPEHPPDTHTTSTWTEGTGKKQLPEPAFCLLQPLRAKTLLLTSVQVAEGTESISPFLKPRKI